MRIRFMLHVLAIAWSSAAIAQCVPVEAKLITQFHDRFDPQPTRMWPWKPWPNNHLCYGFYFKGDQQYDMPKFKREIVQRASNTWKKANLSLRIEECPSDQLIDPKKQGAGLIYESNSLDSPDFAAQTEFFEFGIYINDPGQRSPDTFAVNIRRKFADNIFEAGKTLYWGTETPPKGYLDAWSVLVHEFGHVLGIDHPSAKQAAKYCNYKTPTNLTATMCPNSFPRQIHPRTLAPVDVSELRNSLQRRSAKTQGGYSSQGEVKRVSSLTHWLPPTEETWSTRANQVLVGTVIEISEPFSSSNVKLPELKNSMITPEYLQTMRWIGQMFIRIKIRVETPIRGVKKGQIVTVTTLHEELNFKAGDERLFFLNSNSRLLLIEKPEVTRIVPVTIFAGSPQGSTFVRSRFRTNSFENEYRIFSLEELERMGHH
jgi:hypothetical protein